MQLPIVHELKQNLPALTVLSGNVLFKNTRGDRGAPPDRQLMSSHAVPTALAGAFNLDFPIAILIAILVQPCSRGIVTLRSADPEDAPVIDPCHLKKQADVDTLVSAVNLARKLMSTRACAEVYDGEIAPGPEAKLDEFVRGAASTRWHPAGTCKMGSDKHAVVDQGLKVRGLEGLRVADASVMPTVTSGNTDAASAMIAEKPVDML